MITMDGTNYIILYQIHSSQIAYNPNPWKRFRPTIAENDY